jgi:hypothetical protein
MEIIAHGLWAAAGATAARKSAGARIRVGWTVWWAMFPDLLAFGPPVAIGLWLLLTGGANVRSMRADGRINTFVLASQILPNLPGNALAVINQSFGQGGGRLANLPARPRLSRRPRSSTLTITSSFILMVAGCPIVTRLPVEVKVRKPVAPTSSSYEPGCTASKTYPPLPDAFLH